MDFRVSMWALLLLGFLVIQIDPVFSCDAQEIQRCLTVSGFADLMPKLNGVPNIDIFKSACSAYKSYKSCYDTATADCVFTSTELQQIRAAYSSVEYMCQDQYNAIIKYARCWNQDQVQNAMKQCRSSTAINNNGLPSDCSKIKQLNQCVANVVRDYCGVEAASIMTGILQHTESINLSLQTCGNELTDTKHTTRKPGSSQDGENNSGTAFQPKLTSLLLALSVAVLVTYGNRLGPLLL